MPLPKETDARIRKRFDDLFKDGKVLLESSGQKQTDAGHIIITHFNYSDFCALKISAQNLIQQIVDKSTFQQISKEIQALENAALNAPGRTVYSTTTLYATTTKILGILKGLKHDYESGMLDDLSQRIETNVTYDFMDQAGRLLGGERHKYDHVPAAVLAGAVLENAIRSLCQRQEPPIKTEASGKPKKLDLLISDLQKSDAFNKPKAAQLRSWVSIRNSAAHGRFNEFDRTQVEQMIPGIETFLADYL